MRFTVIGHACLFIETGDATILVDPWLGGSCYWRSWWHYPPIDIAPEWLRPDFIYITHHHFDHMHYPSLRRIDRSAKVMMARFGVDQMPKEFAALGFEKVRELPHGDVIEISPGVEVASFQYGFDDSAFLVKSGDTVLCNMNDSKVRGRALAQVRDTFGPPTFMLKGHSYAITYPLCYEADDPVELQLVSRDSFAEDFIETALELGTKYAVPFASSVAFLHPEAIDHNQHHVSPPEVEARFREDSRVAGIEPVQMVPGDSWDSDTGFQLSPDDWYADRPGRLRRLQADVMPKIEKSLEIEANTKLDWDVFEAHQRTFIRALPPLAARLLLRRSMVFEVASSPERYWVVNCAAKQIYRTSELPADWGSLWQVPEGVLADAIEKDIFCLIVGSMRVHVRVAKGGISTDLAFWGLYMMKDQNYLPITRVIFTRRFWSALFRRRREAYDQIESIMRGGGSLLNRLSSGFTKEHEAVRE